MRGVHIAAFVLCFSLSIGLLSGLGWFGHVGVHPDPGVDNSEVVEEEAENVEAAGEGGSDDGVLGTITAVGDVLNSLWSMTAQTKSMLENLGTPTAIASAIDIIVKFAVLITMLQVIRGMRFQ